MATAELALPNGDPQHPTANSQLYEPHFKAGNERVFDA
jgi:hypothetical protein